MAILKAVSSPQIPGLVGRALEWVFWGGLEFLLARSHSLARSHCILCVE